MDNATALVLADAVKDLAAAIRELTAANSNPSTKRVTEGLLNREGKVLSREDEAVLLSIDMGAHAASVTRLFFILSRPEARELISREGFSTPLIVKGSLIDVSVLIEVYSYFTPGCFKHYGRGLHHLLGSWVAQLKSAA